MESNLHPFSFFSSGKHSKFFVCRVTLQHGDLQSHKFDYEVLKADRVIGRIYFNEEAGGPAKWFWDISGVPARGGSAETLHDAKEAMSKALDSSRNERADETAPLSNQSITIERSESLLECDSLPRTEGVKTPDR